MSTRVPVVIQVLDANRQAVEGAFVYVEASTAAFPEVSLITDDKGQVRVSLPAGKFRFGAKRRDRRGSGTVEVDASAQQLTLEVVLG